MTIVTPSSGACTLSPRAIPTGTRFGSWEVVSRTEDQISPNGKRRPRYLCRCDCGGAKEVLAQNLLHGDSRSCGCVRVIIWQERATRHGQSRSRLYKMWTGMRGRCTDLNHADYSLYGARGIRVCEAWHSFEVFAEWARANGYEEGLTLDRIDNDGNYEPANCRWVTRSRQMRNTRLSTILTAFGETKSIHDWAEDSRCKVNVETLRDRLSNYHWDTEKAIITPSLRSRTWHPKKTPNWRHNDTGMIARED